MDTTKSLRILAVDMSGLFRTHWEIAQGKTDSAAFTSTVAAVARARDGFDRVAVCCDTGRSFRRTFWPEYKANRVDPGEGYRHQLQRTIEQLEADGCTVFRAPLVNIADDTGEAFYAEADDVIGTICRLASEGGHFVRIYSADKDLCQLLSEGCDRMNFKGEIMTPDGLIEKLGVSPSLIPDYLVLVGDASDNFKAFPGIGPVKALAMLKQCGSALGVFAPEKLAQIHLVTGDAIAKQLRTEGAKERAERCLRVATVLRDVELSFDPLLAEPVFKTPEAAPKINFAPATPPPQAPVVVQNQADPVHTQEPRRPAVALVRRAEPSSIARLDQYALEPQDTQQAWILAETLHLSQMYRQQYPNPQAIMAVILRGRSLGIPSVTALESAYVVNGRVGWAARMLRALAMQSPDCEYFRIAETTMHKAVALCKRQGEPELVVISTTEQARERGLVVGGGKWAKDPLSMNVADVERRGARLVWPERVTGLFTPDELEMGRTAEGEILEAA